MTSYPTALAVLLVLIMLPLMGSQPVVQVDGCTELVSNGGFEAGHMGWTQSSSGGFVLIGNDNPFTGTAGAYLAGVNDADDRLEQAVWLPPEAAAISLRARWSMATEETAGVFDTLAFSLIRPDGSTIALAKVDNTAEPGLWRELRVLAPYIAGQQFKFRVQAQTDASNPTAFFLDDVSLLACPTAGAPRNVYLPLIPHRR